MPVKTIFLNKGKERKKTILGVLQGGMMNRMRRNICRLYHLHRKTI
jgi:hypothetical protein